VASNRERSRSRDGYGARVRTLKESFGFHFAIDGLVVPSFSVKYPWGRTLRISLCRESRLIIELDGGQHAISEKDILRDNMLAARGYRTLRFWNNDVLMNIDGVLVAMGEALALAPHPPCSPSASMAPSPRRRGEGM
jgi:hypothetical protein